MSTINSDEHDAKHGVRSGPEQPLAQEHHNKPGASSYQQGNSGKQRGDVKRAEASARTSEHDRAFIMNHKTSSRRGSPRGEGRSTVERTLRRKSLHMLHTITCGPWPTLQALLNFTILACLPDHLPLFLVKTLFFKGPRKK